MTQKIKKLRLTRIDFVDRGANPGAHIALYKRATPAPAGEEGMAETLDTAAVEELQKRADTAEAENAKMAKRLEVAEAAMATVKDERAKEHAVKKAAEWQALGAADALGGLLYECRKQLSAETLAALETNMAAWSAQIAAGALFAEAGRAALDADSPDTKLEALAKAYAEKHTVSYEQGYAAVTKTAEGKALYAAIRGGK